MNRSRRRRDPSSNRYYVYKVVVDAGGAPCVYHNRLSLAICKPAIRRTAQVGDLIFGFSSNDDEIQNRLVYIAEVTEKVTKGDYYFDPRYENRPDCIYEWTRGGYLVLRDDARHHQFADARPRDVGRYPGYRNAQVLLSTNFRYFGGSGTDEWKQQYRSIKRLVENLGQGHRVHHPRKVREELLELKNDLWRTYSKRKLGNPLHGRGKQKVCHSASHDEDDVLAVTETGCERVT